MPIFIISSETAPLGATLLTYSVASLSIYWMLKCHREVATSIVGMFLAERNIERFAKMHGNDNFTFDKHTHPIKES